MNARTIRLHLLATLAFGTLTLAAWAADEKNTSLDQLPPEAQAAIVKATAGHQIAEVEQEMQDGVAVYEAEWHVNGLEHEVAVLADGALLESEEEVAPANVPAAVRAAIERQFGRSDGISVDRKMVVFYEAEGKVDGKIQKIVILPTGKVHGQAHDDDSAGDDDDAHEK